MSWNAIYRHTTGCFLGSLVLLWSLGGCPEPIATGEFGPESTQDGAIFQDSTPQEPLQEGLSPDTSTKDNPPQDTNISESTPESTQDKTPEATPEPIAETTPDASTTERTEPTQESNPSEQSTDAGNPEAPPAAWTIPTCTQVTGLASIAISKDGGKTLFNGGRNWPTGIYYTYGLVALRAANTLIAQYRQEFYRSTDAGCTWQQIGTTTDGPMRLVLGPNDRVWAWSDNRDALYRIDGTTITKLKSPTPNILGLGVDPKDPQHIVIGAELGILHETKDGGTLWKRMGTPVTQASSVITYRVSFHPTDLQHVITGITREGFFVSTNGGQSWTKSTGLTVNPGDPANGFNVVFSPSNGQIVWAMAIDLNDTSSKGGGKKLYRSEDGGLTFNHIVTNQQQQDLTLINGPNLVPHPTDTNILYWAFGTCASQYGSNIHIYDHSTHNVTIYQHPYPSFDEIVFSPASPNVIYLGIQTNSSPLCPR